MYMFFLCYHVRFVISIHPPVLSDKRIVRKRPKGQGALSQRGPTRRDFFFCRVWTRAEIIMCAGALGRGPRNSSPVAIVFIIIRSSAGSTSGGSLVAVHGGRRGSGAAGRYESAYVTSGFGHGRVCERYNVLPTFRGTICAW